ncbi:hypothetical protein, partial [Bifidobacterium bifidum]|uniref:hypothetical protein n=1 Tax=Bifidobacterium bifidum TaxID=1681 RepID=UPI00321A6CC0
TGVLDRGFPSFVVPVSHTFHCDTVYVKESDSHRIATRQRHNVMPMFPAVQLPFREYGGGS